MTKKTNIAATSLLALVLAGSTAFAQTALIGNDALDERIDTVQENVAEELAKAEADSTSGSNQYAQGWTGSISASLSATSGNTQTNDVSIAGRLNYGAGAWNHTLGLGVEYGKDNGVETKENAFAVYDANRYVSDNLYVFGLGSLQYDKFASNKYDAFLGFGPGYRVINRDNMTWRVQAGPGVRYTETQLGATNTEWAGMASSRFYYGFSDTISLTNDTDLLYSDANTVATNDLGINVKVSDAIATRFGYRTEYNSNPVGGLDEFDNTVGISMVYGF